MSKLIRPFHTWSIAQQPHTAPHHQQGPGRAGCSLGEQGMELTKAEQAGRAEMAAAAMQSGSPNPAKLLPLGAIQESLLLYSRKQHTACFCTVLHPALKPNAEHGDQQFPGNVRCIQAGQETCLGQGVTQRRGWSRRCRGQSSWVRHELRFVLSQVARTQKRWLTAPATPRSQVTAPQCHLGHRADPRGIGCQARQGSRGTSSPG